MESCRSGVGARKVHLEREITKCKIGILFDRSLSFFACEIKRAENKFQNDKLEDINEGLKITWKITT